MTLDESRGEVTLDTQLECEHYEESLGSIPYSLEK
jgi:hypothetical protein